MSTNFYDILGVKKTDSTSDIKKAYKKLALKFHPDKVVDQTKKKESEELFTKISYAYEILSNEKTRSIYDVHGESGIQNNKHQTQHLKIQHQTIKINCTLFELYNGSKKNIEYEKKILDGNFPSFSLLKSCKTSVTVDIPPRSIPGSTVIIENEGISHVREDLNGDLHVELNLHTESNEENWEYSGNYLLYNLRLTVAEWLLGFTKDIIHPSGITLSIYTTDILALDQVKQINPEKNIDIFLIKPILLHPGTLTVSQKNILANEFSYTQPSNLTGINLNKSDIKLPQETPNDTPHVFHGFPQMFQGSLPNFFQHNMHQAGDFQQHMHQAGGFQHNMHQAGGFQPNMHVQQCSQQ